MMADDGANEGAGRRGAAYKLAADEGTALWFTNALVTVKAGGPETGQRLAIVQILHPPEYSPPQHRHLVEDESFLWARRWEQLETGDRRGQT